MEHQLRHLTRNEEPTPNDSNPTYGPYDADFLSNALKKLRLCPASIEFFDAPSDLVGTAVRPMTVADLMWALDELAAPEIHDAKQGGRILRQIRDDQEVMSQSVDEACLAKRGSPLHWSQLALTVDLSKTDDGLRKDFDTWLKLKRREIEHFGPHNWNRFDKKKYRKWHEFRALGCIDLELLSTAAGVHITHVDMAKALFPLGDKGPEHIRDTIRPLANQVLNWGTFAAMVSEAR